MGFYFHDLKDKLVINKYLALGILVPILTATTFLIMPYMTSILGLKLSYHAMHMGNLKGIMLRLIVLSVMMSSVILIYNMMTSKETFLTKIGRNSLSVYVLQFYAIWGFPIILNNLGLGYIFNSYGLTTIYVILATLLTTYILSRDKVQETLNNIINKVTKIILKKDAISISNKNLD